MPHLWGTMKNRRLFRHLLFWLVYFGTVLFYELFLTSDFIDNPSFAYFNRVLLAHLVLMPGRVLIVYYVLYLFIPRWNKTENRLRLASEGLLLLILTVLLNRLLVQYVVWVHIYGYEQRTPITLLSFLARFIFTMLEILQVAGIAATIKLFRMRMASVAREKEIIQEKLTSEIRHLKAQVNPHFLFNSLNSIFSLSRARSEKTPDVVLKLSDILRYMLYESEKKTIPVSSELKIITDYIALQQLRFGERLRVETRFSVEDPSLQITPLLLLPLIENAFKHGAGSVNGETEIKVQLTAAGNTLELRVENPFTETTIPGEPKEGIGLANIRRQLELLYTDYSFIYGKHDNLFVVNLKINLHSYAAVELFNH